MVPTGVAIAITDGHAGLVLPRSGLASKRGLTLANAPGLIDAGYRGEVMRAVVNLDPHDAVEISAGDRIAQLVIVPVAAVTPVFVEELPASTRGAGGFGSTGACPSPPTVVPSPVGSRPRSGRPPVRVSRVEREPDAPPGDREHRPEGPGRGPDGTMKEFTSTNASRCAPELGLELESLLRALAQLGLVVVRLHHRSHLRSHIPWRAGRGDGPDGPVPAGPRFASMEGVRGRGSVVEHHLAKVGSRVRIPSSAPGGAVQALQSDSAGDSLGDIVRAYG